MSTNPLSQFAAKTVQQEPPQNEVVEEKPLPNFDGLISETVNEVANESEPDTKEPDVSEVLEQPVKPIIPEGMSTVSLMSPGNFDAFVKTIEVLQDSNVIEISDSQICQRYKQGIAVLMTDVSPIFDNKQVSFTILNPKKYIKFLRNLRGNNHVAIVDDAAQQRYIFTNKVIKLFIPKPIDETLEDVTIPDLSNTTQLGETITIDKETANQIKGLSGDSVELLVHNDTIKGVYIPETAVYLFEKYSDENIDETNADFLLKAHSFLNVPAEEYKVSTFKTGDDYWLVQECNTGILTINTLEGLTLVTDEVLI